jgi:hypothetical protein
MVCPKSEGCIQNHTLLCNLHFCGIKGLHNYCPWNSHPSPISLRPRPTPKTGLQDDGAWASVTLRPMELPASVVSLQGLRVLGHHGRAPSLAGIVVEGGAGGVLKAQLGALAQAHGAPHPGSRPPAQGVRHAPSRHHLCNITTLIMKVSMAGRPIGGCEG